MVLRDEEVISERQPHLRSVSKRPEGAVATLSAGADSGPGNHTFPLRSLPPWPPGPSLAAPGTHVWVSVSEELVEHVAELPAEHSVAGEGQPVDDRPKGLCPFLMVGAQYAR